MEEQAATRDLMRICERDRRRMRQMSDELDAARERERRLRSQLAQKSNRIDHLRSDIEHAMCELGHVGTEDGVVGDEDPVIEESWPNRFDYPAPLLIAGSRVVVEVEGRFGVGLLCWRQLPDTGRVVPTVVSRNLLDDETEAQRHVTPRRQVPKSEKNRKQLADTYRILREALGGDE